MVAVEGRRLVGRDRILHMRERSSLDVNIGCMTLNDELDCVATAGDHIITMGARLISRRRYGYITTPAQIPHHEDFWG